MEKSILISLLSLEPSRVEMFLDNMACIKKQILEKYSRQDIYDIKIHFDIMDNKFVANTGVDINGIKKAKELGFFADVHLMVENPIKDGYVDKAILQGCDSVTIHYEIQDFEEVLKELYEKKLKLEKENKKLLIGVSVKAETDILVLKKYEKYFDIILIMTIIAGFGGQAYIENMNPKIAMAKKMYPTKFIEIDGGVNFDTIISPLRYGVDMFVIGSYITKLDTVKQLEQIMVLNIQKELESMPKDANVDFQKSLLQINPDGYGKNDELVGIKVPNIRKLALKWYKELNVNMLDLFIDHKYHEYRQFAIFVLSNMIKKAKDNAKYEEIYNFLKRNLEYINNWDLTDEVGPNVVANYLYFLDEKNRKKELIWYLTSSEFWIKRIGIVSLLTFARKSDIDFVFEMIELNLYDEYHLMQKANGWLLREMYKKSPKEAVRFIYMKNTDKQLPRILLSYAMEKMNFEEKEYIMNFKGTKLK